MSGFDLFYEFSTYYTYLVNDVIGYNENDFCMLTIAMKDGSVLLYDPVLGELRDLPKDPLNQSEEEIISEFANRLSTIAAVRGYTQSTLAEVSCLSQATISRYFRGDTTPPIHVAFRFADILRCDINDFTYRAVTDWEPVDHNKYTNPYGD